MPGESINFPITADDRASSSFRSVGRSALDASAKIDVAAASLKIWNAANASSGRSTDAFLSSVKAHTKAGQLWADTLNVMNGRETQFIKLQADAGRRLDDTTGKLTNVAKAAGAAAGTGAAGVPAGTGLGALIGAGVALAPVIATLAVGLTGVGAAAYGIYKPISNAAQATGGLAANLATLNPEQQQVAEGLLALGTQFAAFQQRMQPAVFNIFNSGIRLAATLLREAAPVAEATGAALGALLGRIDAEFQSGTWQQFFGFMAKNAGPDVKQLGDTFINLANALPPLLTALQPLATELLKDVAGVAKLTGELGPLIIGLERVGVATGGVFTKSQQTGGVLGFLAHAVKEAAGQLVPSIPLLGRFQGDLHKVGTEGISAGKGTQFAATYVQYTGKYAASSATQVQLMARAVRALNTAQSNALANLVTYAGDILTNVTNAQALKAALKASGDQIGLHTAKERASFATANTYITGLSNTAQQAIAVGRGTDGAIAAIRRGLPILEGATSKSRLYWQEVRTLVGWLQKLEAQKSSQFVAHVTGSGTFKVATFQGSFGKATTGAASGAFVQAGTGPTADDVVARVSKGELIVPARMVSAGAVDHLRGSIPGFAAGGIIPTYSGNVGGLGPWAGHNWTAAVNSVVQSIAAAMAHSFASIVRSAAFGAAGGLGRSGLRGLESLWMSAGGPGGGIAHIAAAIALAESGGNPRAFNPSGASGIWQILGQVVPGNIFDPFINALNAVKKFRDAGGFSPWVTFTSGAYLQFMDRGGFLPPGRSMVYNATGHPEMVIPHGAMGQPQHIVFEIRGGGSGGLDQLFATWLRKYVRVHGGGSVQTALGRI